MVTERVAHLSVSLITILLSTTIARAGTWQPGARRGGNARTGPRPGQVRRELCREHGGLLDDGLHLQERGDGSLHRRGEPRPDVHVSGRRRGGASQHAERRLAADGHGRLPGARRRGNPRPDPRSEQMVDRLHVQERTDRAVHRWGQSGPDVHLWRGQRAATPAGGPQAQGQKVLDRELHGGQAVPS